MKNINLSGGEVSEPKEGKETEKTGARLDQKSNQEVVRSVKTFFQTFSQKYKEQPAEVLSPQEKLNEEIRALDVNTAPAPKMDYEWKDEGLTQEELQELDENDAGYVNDRVLDYDNDLGKEENTYAETGLHSGAIRWGDYATKEGAEYVTLKQGQIFSRWGSEKGSFMSDANTDYQSLELPVVREKNERSFYEVVKPFPVEVSKIAVQPWNRKDEETSQENEEGVNQYRTPVPIEQLVKNGYLRKI